MNSLYLFSFALIAASIRSRMFDEVAGGLTVVGFVVGVGAEVFVASAGGVAPRKEGVGSMGDCRGEGVSEVIG